MTGRPLTGRGVFLIFAGFFAVIVAVNVTLAVSAVRTFPGLEVPGGNGYVASQSFDDRRAAQQALGWRLKTGYRDGRVTMAFTDRGGNPVEPATVEVLIGRTTEAEDDVILTLSGANGRYTAPVDLDRGKWMMMVDAEATDGTRFHQRRDLWVSAE